jgi:hypothetical protein
MTRKAKRILSNALSLPPRQRAWVAAQLNAASPAQEMFASREIAEAWAGEIERRVREIESGKATKSPASEVHRAIRKRVRARKTG